MTALPMDPDDFAALRSFARRRCGVVLDASTDFNVIRRVRNVVEASEFESVCDLVRRIDNVTLTSGIAALIVDAITTHETSFFRDDTPFEAFEQVILPELVRRRRQESSTQKIRIWSAACSTGQEPYSLAMIVLDQFPDLCAKGQIEILASDVSSVCIEIARKGIYSDFEWSRSSRPDAMRRFLNLTPDGWTMREDLKRLIRFETHNLLDSGDRFGVFDVLLLRNVCIYFSPDERRAVLRRLQSVLDPDGYLLMGSSETLNGLTTSFAGEAFDGAVCYRPADPAEGSPPQP